MDAVSLVDTILLTCIVVDMEITPSGRQTTGGIPKEARGGIGSKWGKRAAADAPE